MAIAAVLLAATATGCTGGDATPMLPQGDDGSPVPSEDALMQIEATGEPLPAGRYTREGFEPRITFELDGTWQAVQLAEGFFDVQQDIGTPHVIAVQFARPLGVYGADAAVEPTSAADAVDILRGNTDLDVVESSPSRIGGLDGEQITVANTGQAHYHVLHVGPGGLGIDPGRRLWIAFVDTDDGLLAIMVGGSTERWDEALAAAGPVLESIEIGS